jgi:hypothetical protein
MKKLNYLHEYEKQKFFDVHFFHYPFSQLLTHLLRCGNVIREAQSLKNPRYSMKNKILLIIKNKLVKVSGNKKCILAAHLNLI